MTAPTTRAKIRLHVPAAYAPGAEVPLAPEQAHYLANVMRQKPGDTVGVFNGSDGEWAAEIAALTRKGGTVRLVAQTGPHRAPPDVWLLFAPLKKARTDFVAQKATEMGAGLIQPVMTKRTIADRVKLDRLAANTVEAAEQCGLTALPQVREPETLDRLLDGWDASRKLLFCDEAGQGAAPILTALAGRPRGEPWAILIGPEGGFDPAEAARLRGLPFVVPVTLGPRIMRADTAAIAALGVWQAVLGDWEG